MDEGDDGDEEEKGNIECTIGKRRAKFCRFKVNVNGLWDIFSMVNRMLQESNIEVKRHRKKKRRSQDLIIKKEVYDEVKNLIHSSTINKALSKLKVMQLE